VIEDSVTTTTLNATTLNATTVEADRVFTEKLENPTGQSINTPNEISLINEDYVELTNKDDFSGIRFPGMVQSGVLNSLALTNIYKAFPLFPTIAVIFDNTSATPNSVQGPQILTFDFSNWRSNGSRYPLSDDLCILSLSPSENIEFEINWFRYDRDNDELLVSLTYFGGSAFTWDSSSGMYLAAFYMEMRS
jgi:hypothetical protein